MNPSMRDTDVQDLEERTTAIKAALDRLVGTARDIRDQHAERITELAGAVEWVAR